MKPIGLSVLTVIVLYGQQVGRADYGPSDVRAYGAAGDGIADDYPAISAGIRAAAAAGGALYFPRGAYRFSSGLQLGYSNVQLVCEAGAVLKFGNAGTAVAFANEAPRAANNIGIDGCTIDGGGVASDGILLQRAHHVSFRNVRVRNVTAACLRTKFSVIGEYTNFRCTINEEGAATMPVNGLVLGEDGPGEQTTASTFLNAIVEGVTGDGIVLDSAANLVFTAGTSENHHGGWGMTISPRSANITVVGMDFEDNLSGAVETRGSENVFLNILATGLFQVGSGARGNTIANSRVNRVVFDPGSYNNVMRENDYAIEDGKAEPADRGTNNSVYANYNAGSQRYAQGYIRFPVDPAAVLGAAVSAGRDAGFRSVRVTDAWTVVAAAPTAAGWRAVLIGTWSGANGIGPTTLTEATPAAPSVRAGAETVSFRVNAATGLLEARGSATLRFTGAVFVTAE